MQKQTYLKKFREARTQWDALLIEVGESRMNIPGVTGTWTFKDLIAHLTGWRKRTLARVRAGCGHEPTEPLPWPAEFDANREADLELINEYLYNSQRDLPLQRILDESRQVLDELERALADLPEPAFADVHCFAWLKGKPLGEADLFAHLHKDHEADIRVWMEKLRLYA